MLNMDHVESKTRLPGQIALKLSSPSRGHSFTSIFMKLYQNVCLDNISIIVEIQVMSDQNLGYQVKLL